MTDHPLRNYIGTYQGKRFNPLNPSPKDVSLYDIAHSLSQQCRFTGHTKEFYSVAQHCVLVSEILRDDPLEALAGLFHDASEAYLSDIASPVKHTADFVGYRRVEEMVTEAIFQAFDIPIEFSILEDLKEADRRLCMTEARDLMPPDPDLWAPQVQRMGEPYKWHVTPWPSQVARRQFIVHYYRLMKRLKRTTPAPL